jgi:2-hydroxychromene-2-carboxylate isomerase
MTRTVEFFFDFMSPPTYLAYTQMPGLIARTGAVVIWKPMYTIGLHQLTGNQSPILVPAKGAWIAKDLARYVKRYGIEFVPNSHQPVKVVPSLRGAIVAQEQGCLGDYISAIFSAMWTKNLNIGDLTVLREILVGAGLDASNILAGIETPEVKAKLVANTQEAATRGAFGAPSFFVGDELYWGQDRLPFVEEALLAG